MFVEPLQDIRDSYRFDASCRPLRTERVEPSFHAGRPFRLADAG